MTLIVSSTLLDVIYNITFYTYMLYQIFLDRFDDGVIEERQKQTMSMLLFAGNMSYLYTSEPFIKFFEVNAFLFINTKTF